MATIVAPAMLFVGASYSNYVRSFAEARDRLIRENDIVYEHAVKVFETHSFVLRQVNKLISGLSDEQIHALEKLLHDDMAQMISGFPQLKDVFIHDRNGLPLVSTSTYPVPRQLSVAERDYFYRQAAGDAGVYVSRVWSGRLEHAPFFSLTQRRPSPDGAFDGIISVSIQPGYFEQFYRDVVHTGLGDGSIVGLTRADGVMLVRFPPLASAGQLSVASPFERGIAIHPDRGSFEGTSEFDSVARLTAYRKLPHLPIYVVMGMPRAAVVNAWLRDMGRQLIYGLPATLGLFLITLVALHRTQYAAAEVARREQAEAALRHAQKLEAIGQLTGGIAHDFNNLLAVISGSVQLLRRHTQDTAKFLDAIERAARRGERLTRQLLTFSRRRRNRLSVVDLKERLPTIAEMLERTLRGDIRLRVQISNEVWRVDVDADELELALLNLAVNAQDAISGSGTLTISARNVTLTADTDGGAGLTGDFVAVSVCDTGAGMPPEVAARAFEPFFTTKPAGKGSGLGLSQVYAFANHCGGTAVVRSTPGEGTCVVLYVPRAGRIASRAAAEPAPDEAQTPGLDLMVLLVEDDPEVRETTAALLEDIGCQVESVGSATEAQDILAASASKFDLVLSDIVMPESISGIELARELRAKYPELPVVLMTGYSGAGGAADEGQPILFKPFTRAQLEEVVREYTGTRQLSLTAE